MSDAARQLSRHYGAKYRVAEAAWRASKRHATRTGRRGDYLVCLVAAMEALGIPVPERMPRAVGDGFTIDVGSGPEAAVVESSTPHAILASSSHGVIVIPLVAAAFLEGEARPLTETASSVMLNPQPTAAL